MTPVRSWQVIYQHHPDSSRSAPAYLVKNASYVLNPFPHQLRGSSITATYKLRLYPALLILRHHPHPDLLFLSQRSDESPIDIALNSICEHPRILSKEYLLSHNLPHSSCPLPAAFRPCAPMSKEPLALHQLIESWYSSKLKLRTALLH